MRGISRAVKEVFAFCEGLCSTEAPRHNVAHVRCTLQAFARKGKGEGKTVTNQPFDA